ncbi:MAG: NAD-dependent nucleoside diphosphate-sugar epimerase/dehydratase [Candidatus Roseilinea sp.]|nr:MAG: NAD-dependent nucleoside diphosphate-sugar epimerase/dehydratase [Candidatus Roseilinea sp.]
MATILITGGTGLIGRHAAKLLCARGHAVRILSRRARPDVPLLRGLPVDYAQGDVRDPASLAPAFAGCDAAVLSHQFQNFPVENPKRNETFDAVDRAGTEHCVAAAREAGVRRLVYMSGIALGNPNPPHPGIRAKWAAERAIFESGIPAIALRVNVVYAADDKYFPRLARAARRSPFVPIPGAGAARCAPVHVDDVARAIAHAIERSTISGVVNVCGPDEVTWKELLLAVAQVNAAGQRKIPLPIPQRLLLLAGWMGERLPTPALSRDAVIFATRFDQSCRDGISCSEAFGFQPIGLREGLRMTFAERR